MNGRERIMAIFNRKPTDRCGFWKGNPHEETGINIGKHLNTGNDVLSLSLALNDDMIWLMADEISWKHPEGKPMFDFYGGKHKESLGQMGVFGECTSVEEVEAYEWPNPDYLDFTEYEKIIDQAIEKGLAICGGFWSPFYHQVADFFGMENYFIKMYTDPEVVEAVTNHLVDFYVEANNRCFKALGNKIDIFFFGNDFGSQLDLLISPDCFKKFVLPGFQKLVDTGKTYNKKIMLHSCGAINKAIPLLIDAGIDALHPLQANAANMDPETLSQYKDDIIFVGGIDTQALLPNGTPEQIKVKVNELKDILGPGLIVSPSHECLLPDVPIENILALRDAATEIK